MDYFHVQADSPWYNFFIPPSSVLTLISVKYIVLKFAISGKVTGGLVFGYRKITTVSITQSQYKVCRLSLLNLILF